MSPRKSQSPTRIRRSKQKARRPAAKERASGDVGRAMALLAHEIRTPLNGILAFGELLAASDLPERERAWATAIKDAALHLDRLTSLIVDSAKAKASGLALKTEPFRPRGLAEALAASLTARAEAKGLVPRIAVADSLPEMAVGDPLRLRAALENLIDNAVKFTERGHVDFSVTAEPTGRGRTRLVFSVSDDGIGLTAAEIRRLFRPFSQASDATARRFGGAGLGLAFAAAAAKAMGGKLSVTSAAGHGSTFCFTALVGKSDGGPLAQAVPGTAPAGRKLRILCAEDNPYGRVVLNTILTSLGHKIDFVGTGEAAVEAMTRAIYDLVLMDITLPLLDGIQATRRIRALPGEIGKVHIVGLSGRAGAAEEKAAREAGMNDYLTKPVSAETLARAIAAG